MKGVAIGVVANGHETTENHGPRFAGEAFIINAPMISLFFYQFTASRCETTKLYVVAHHHRSAGHLIEIVAMFYETW